MTIYADAETRETWRINYGILKLESARDAHDFWERRGGVFPGCVLALAHALEQIDADEDLMQDALHALEYHVAQTRPIQQTHDAITALKERLA